MSILLIGHVCIDQNESESSSYESWGSALMYMAHYFKGEHNIEPSLLAPYGKDFLNFSDQVRLLTPPGSGRTLLYKNYTNTTPRIWQCANTEDAEPLPLNQGIIEKIKQADIICMAPLLPNYSVDYAKALLSHRKPHAITALQAAGYLRQIDAQGNVKPREFKEAADLIPLFDLVFLSSEDIPNALNQAKQWAKHSPTTGIIVTQAEAGASLVQSDSVTPVRTKAVPPEKVKDSVGCGDVFCAATLYSYYNNRSIIKAIEQGNEAARSKLFASGSSS